MQIVMPRCFLVLISAGNGDDKAYGQQDHPDLEVVTFNGEEALNNSEMDVEMNLKKGKIRDDMSMSGTETIQVIPSDVTTSTSSSENVPERPCNTRRHANGDLIMRNLRRFAIVKHLTWTISNLSQDPQRGKEI